jgi:hypothetical protein
LSRDEALEHEAIKDAVIRRDADEAVALLSAHYQRTVEIIHQLIPDYTATGRKSACPSSNHLGRLSLFKNGGSGSSWFDVKPLCVDGSSGGFGWSVS